MARLIPLPDPNGSEDAALAWVNAEHITTAVPILDRASETPRLFVELKLQGHPVVRYWLATGHADDLEVAWSRFVNLANGL